MVGVELVVDEWMSGGWEVDGWMVGLDEWMGGGEEMQSNLRTGAQAPPPPPEFGHFWHP